MAQRINLKCLLMKEKTTYDDLGRLLKKSFSNGYCWGNPVGLVDLDGNWGEWIVSCLKGVMAHIVIEADIIKNYSSETNIVRINVPIKGGGKGRTRTGNGFADIVMKLGNTYSVYEIKPSSQDPTRNGNVSQKQTAGQIQLQGYVNAIEAKILDDPAAIQLFASGFTLLTNSFCSE